MPLPPEFAVSPDILLSHFGSATVARGQRYANLGWVRDVAWRSDGLELTGRCFGSGNNDYRVSVSFERAGGAVVLEWASCSCPVGEFCKHSVALLLASASGDPVPPSRDRWRTVLTHVLDEMAVADAGADSPIGLEFSLAPPTRYRSGNAVAVRPLTLGKRGAWIKTGLSWRHLMHHSNAGAFDRRQYVAVRAIATELQRSIAVPVGEAMTINTVGREFWALMNDALEAGVTVVADRSRGLQAVEFVKTAQLRLDFASDHAGGATMSVALFVDGERCDPGGVGLIGAPSPHGMSKATDGVLRLGGFDPVPGRTTLELIARDEQVHIPADTVAEFSVDILPRLIDVAPVEIEEALFTPPTISGPYPVLTVRVSDSGAQASWSTRYDVNDKHHDFDPDSTRQRTGYRDGRAEDRAWQQVIPALRAVAAASGTWKRQAVQRVTRNINRQLDAALLSELRAITEAAGAADAAAAASLPTLCGAVELTRTEAAVLCGETLPKLDCRGAFTIEIDQSAPDFRPADTAPVLRFGSGDGEPVGNDWFDLSILVEVDGNQVPISALISELSSGATHMLLPSGVYFRLDTPELSRLRALLEEARALGEIEGDRINAGSYNVTLWEELLALGVVDQQLAKWRESLARLSTARPAVRVEVPEGINATLRDYQRDGLDWLSFLWDNGLGGVLADDMGLGKTVQTLALIARVANAGSRKFLVVAPTSVVTNWAAEARKFTPGLSVVAVTGTEARSGRSLTDLAAGADIVITSYALLRIDFAAYAAIDWEGVILDEAQFVKNHNSKTHQCARRLDARFKLAITGTPMENNLMELWSLLSITAPGLFPSPKAFTEYFRKPIESGTGGDLLPVLRRRIKPVMLRRTKSQVASDLPAKQEQVLTMALGTRHRKIYDTRMARERQKVLGLLGEWEKNRFEVFRSLTLLRQLSLHAGMVDETMMDIGSSKVDFLAEQLPELIAEGHSALVFSQFTGFLSILRSQLDAVGVSYSYLAGSSSSREREAAVQRFRSGANQVFLISLKAGGFGLNLTEADYCFVCDPWWSPAAEAQAVDRTHRIGQTRPVTVYRLVSEGTIEEKVVGLQDRKRALFSAVIDEGEVFGSTITASDVRELFG
ncbi:DEAD/DEAH box helicase [soil metagenome]